MLDTKWKEGTKLMECAHCHTTLVVDPLDDIMICWGCLKWCHTGRHNVTVGGSASRLTGGMV